MATGLLHTADKVPSSRPEQELTPGGSGLGGPVARLGQQESPSSQPCAPTGPGSRQLGVTEGEALAGKAVLETTSVERQGRSRKRAVLRRPRPRNAAPPPPPREGEAGPCPALGAACRVLTWGTTRHALSRGHPLAPSSVDPRSRRSTSLCLAGLGGARMLALPTPGLSAPTRSARCAPPGAEGAPRWPSLVCLGLSGVAHEPWEHPGSLPPFVLILRFHMHPTFSEPKWG